MTGTNHITSFLLSELQSEFLPEGGLRRLEEVNNPIFAEKEDAENLWKKWNGKTAADVFRIFLLASSFSDRHLGFSLLEFALQKAIITPRDLFMLYRMQNKEVRTRSPLITLTDIWNTAHRAFVESERKTKEESTAIAAITQADILAVIDEFIEVNSVDVRQVFMQWYYHSEAPIPLSEKFFAHYVKEISHPFGIDGKLASLIAIGAHKAFPHLISLDFVIERFISLARYDGESHGVHRFGFLAFEIAGEDKALRKRVVTAWGNALSGMLFGRTSTYACEGLCEWFFKLTDVTDKEKRVVANLLVTSTREKMTEYLKVQNLALKYA